MACDRFVNFQTVPPRETIGKALEDYLGEIAVSVNWDEKGHRFFAHLIGKGSNPFKRLVDIPLREEEERWIEVVFGDDNIDVLTRRQDELTNNIANGFAKLIARFWQGTYTPEGGD